MNSNLFGTDGIRTQVGTPPITLDSLPQLGNAIGTWLCDHYHNPQLIIACDTRASNHWIISALSTGLLLHPITMHVAGILPTPALCRLLYRSSQFDIGVMISASHNPYQDNGIKLVDRLGKLKKSAELAISRIYHKSTPMPYTTYGSMHPHASAYDDYTHIITSLFTHSFLKGITVVLDCAHGALFRIAPAIFKKFGAKVIVLNAQPNGKNINKQCGSLHVKKTQQAVKKYNATIGFAFDGDGDRVIAINNKGDVKNGDDMLALLSQHSTYRKQQTIVGTVMSNLGLDAYLQQHGKTLVRTQVGDKHIAHHIAAHHLLLGGEQSGHIILHDYLPTGDGIFTALRLCQTMLETENWHLQSFDHYPQILVNVPVTAKKDLTAPEITSLIKDYEAQLPQGRLVIRYSGTENMLRIMVEDQSKTAIAQISSKLTRSLEKYLQ